MGDSLFVRRGELAELGDGSGDDLQGEINVSLRRVAAEAEAQAGSRFLGGQTDSGEDVRRFDRAGRTCSTGGAGETL